VQAVQFHRQLRAVAGLAAEPDHTLLVHRQRVYTSATTIVRNW
jgi:hypothetical protein